MFGLHVEISEQEPEAVEFTQSYLTRLLSCLRNVV